jgi:hypothetical protein
MNKIVIGIDPDSDGHGFALYRNGELERLERLYLIDIIDWVNCNIDELVITEFHIEDVCANNAAFAKRGVKNPKAATAINRSVGKCQQAQIELERVLEHYGVKVVKHKISRMWKSQDGKEQFQRITGWKGRSNEDSRSAAYFGWLGCR